VAALAITPDSGWLVTGNSDKTARISDPSTDASRGVLDSLDSEVAAVAVAPHGRWLAITTRHGTVRIWDSKSGVLRQTLQTDEWVTALAIGPEQD
jgi:WD40 repeat protein